MYLYTDEVEFAPVGSKENRKSRNPESVMSHGGRVHLPSPKSIYRLADRVYNQFSQVQHTCKYLIFCPLQYDVPALKNLALDYICSRLTECDVVEESFSRFTFQ